MQLDTIAFTFDRWPSSSSFYQLRQVSAMIRIIIPSSYHQISSIGSFKNLKLETFFPSKISGNRHFLEAAKHKQVIFVISRLPHQAAAASRPRLDSIWFRCWFSLNSILSIPGTQLMAFGLYSLLEACLLFVNAIAILHEERFLSKSEYLYIYILISFTFPFCSRLEQSRVSEFRRRTIS